MLPLAKSCQPTHDSQSCRILTENRYDYKTGAISADVAEQAEQCMQNIAAALAEAGSGMGDVVRVRYILPDRKEFQKTW